MIMIKSVKSGFNFQFIPAIVLFLAMPGLVHALPPNKIIQSRFIQDSHGETLTITLKKKPKFKYFALPNPERIILDIYNTFLPQVSRKESVNSRTVKTLRMSQNTKKRTRIVLDMKQKTDFLINHKKIPGSSRHILTLHITSPADTNPTPHGPEQILHPSNPAQAHTPSPARNFIKAPALPPITISKLKTTDPGSPMPGKTPTTDNAADTVSATESHISSDKTSSASSATAPQPQDSKKSNVILFDSEIPDDIFNLEEMSQEPLKKRPFSFSGSIQTRGALDTSNNQENEHSTAIRNRTILKAGYNTLFTISALSDYLYFGNDNSSDDYDLDFYETYVTLPFNAVTLSLGKKILRWGKTDQMSPVDTINPEDFREFIVPDYEDRKIPVWMADLLIKFNTFSLEGVYLPKFEPARQDYFNSDWGVYSHIKEDIKASPLLPDYVKNYINAIHVHETMPHDSGLNGEAAFRAFTTIKGWDMGITYHYAWEDLPFYKSFPIKNITTNGTMEGSDLTESLGNAVFTNESIQTRYLRSHIIGFEFETTLGDYGIRGEAAWQDKQSFLTSDLTSIRSPTLIYIIGADYSGMDWYINVQLSHSHIFDHDDSILYFKQNTIPLLGEITRNLNSEWLKASLHYSVTLNDNEFYLSPRLVCTYITNLDLILGAHIFGGNQTSFMGRFDSNDQVFLDATYHF